MSGMTWLNRPAARSARRAHRRPGQILTYLVLVFWTFVCLFPLYWVAITSLKGEYEIVGGPFYLPFVDFTPSIDAWSFVLLGPNREVLRGFLNSATVAVSATLLTLLLGALAVYGLTRFRYALPWRSIWLALLTTGLAAAAVLSPAVRLPAVSAIAVVVLLLLALPTRFLRGGPVVGNQGIL